MVACPETPESLAHLQAAAIVELHDVFICSPSHRGSSSSAVLSRESPRPRRALRFSIVLRSRLRWLTTSLSPRRALRDPLVVAWSLAVGRRVADDRKLVEEKQWWTSIYLRLSSLNFFPFHFWPWHFQICTEDPRIDPEYFNWTFQTPPICRMVLGVLIVLNSATNYVICKDNLTISPQTSQMYTLIHVKCKWTHKCII